MVSDDVHPNLSTTSGFENQSRMNRDVTVSINHIKGPRTSILVTTPAAETTAAADWPCPPAISGVASQLSGRKASQLLA